MRDYIYSGGAPCEEDCVQVTSDGSYLPAMRAECNRFIKAIRAKLGDEPDGASLRIKTEQHDFGSYLEVVCYFDPENEKSVEYAYRCESDCPSTWEEAFHCRRYETDK